MGRGRERERNRGRETERGGAKKNKNKKKEQAKSVIFDQRFELPEWGDAWAVGGNCLLEGLYAVWLVAAVALRGPLFATLGTVGLF